MTERGSDQHSERAAESVKSAVAPGSSPFGIRVGQGFDVHPFLEEHVAGEIAQALVLGGVTFDGERGLVGHSDADVPAHAAADALLGAAGLGDLGQHFPDDDPTWANANSVELLSNVAALVRAQGFEIGNVDVKLVCERPKIAPRRAEMERNLTDAVGAPVTVSGRRPEGLGALGRGEGIAAYAVAVIGLIAAPGLSTSDDSGS